MSAPRQEQRKDGFTADVDKLAGILAKWPGASVTITDVYRTKKWWRVSVRVGLFEAFAPRFEAFDDAVSFRLRAVEMATRADPC